MKAVLIIIVMLTGGSTESGAHTAMSQITFTNMESCQLAAYTMIEKGSLAKTAFSFGLYEIKAKCVEVR